MPRGTQLSVMLPNKPGQLAKLGMALARAKVNIDAISVVDSAEAGLIRIVTSSNAKARTALRKAGIEVMQQSVLVVKLPNEPGSIQQVTKKLADAKVNIEYVYGSGAGMGEPSLLVIGVSDIAEAVKVDL